MEKKQNLSKKNTLNIKNEPYSVEFHNLNNNVKMSAEKIWEKKYQVNFTEGKGTAKNIYSKVVELEKDIKEYSKHFFVNLFKRIKEAYITGTVVLFTALALTGCSSSWVDTLTKWTNPTLAPYVLNQSFNSLQKLYQWEINYVMNLNNFNPDVYKQKWTAYITVPKKFQEFITNDWQIALENVIDYINKNKTNWEKLDELYKVDWTIFQKWALYELTNSNSGSTLWDLGQTIQDSFNKEYGMNYPTYSTSDLMSKKIMVVSNFIKSPIFNWQNDEESQKLLSIMESVVWKINEDTPVEVKDLIKINQEITKYWIDSNAKIFEERGMYGTYIMNNLIFLLTKAPKEYVDNLLSNWLKFEVGYWDNWYLNIMGHIIYSKNAKITYDDKFVKYVKLLNDSWTDNWVEISLEPNSIVMTEKGNVVVPGEIKSLIKFFNSNPDSELKKVLINSTTLSDYMVNKYSKIDKKWDKQFFVTWIKTLVDSFKKDFNLTDANIENLFKYGNINWDVAEINIYWTKLNLVKNTFSNKYIPDYYDKILMNNPNFTTLIHENSHKFHLNKINQATNSGSYNFITELSSYPYTSNYDNDPIFKNIFQTVFYKAYKNELKPAELDYFGYYALSTFNYFEFIAELNSAYLSYPKYDEYIKTTDPVNSKLFLDLQKSVHSDIMPKSN